MLCERTGLGRGSLYHAFNSNQSLYEKALRYYQELGLRAQAEILQDPGTLTEKLRALMQWGIDSDLDPATPCGCMALFSVMERSGKDPPAQLINHSYVTKLETLLCHSIAAAQSNGELTSDRSPQQISRAFLASYYGLRILGRSMPDRVYLTGVLEGILAQL